MSLRPKPLPLVPEATAVAVHAAFAKGHLYVELRAEFGRLYDDQLFADPPKLAKISWVCAILDDEKRYRPPHKSMRHSAHACPFPSSMVPRPSYSPHVPKRGVKKAPGPHPYKARSGHQYGFIDGRQMDFALDGVKWWSLVILEGYSRTILAGAMAPTEATWVALMVLDTACARYGVPHTLVSGQWRGLHLQRL